MTLVEEVINEETRPRTVHLRCNWCSAEFDYTEPSGRAHFNTNCPWCKELVRIPRNRLHEIARRGYGESP